MTPRALAAGVGMALAVALPAVLVVQLIDALDDGDGTPGAAYPFAVVVLAGMAVGGWVAGGRASRQQAGAGALVGLVAIAVVQAVGVARLAVAGDDVTWAALPATAVVAMALGAGGAALAARQPGRTRP